MPAETLRIGGSGLSGDGDELLAEPLLVLLREVRDLGEPAAPSTAALWNGQPRSGADSIVSNGAKRSISSQTVSMSVSRWLTGGLAGDQRAPLRRRSRDGGSGGPPARAAWAHENGAFGLSVALEVTIPGAERETAEKVAARAHQVCPYSRATRGNIEVFLSVA